MNKLIIFLPLLLLVLFGCGQKTNPAVLLIENGVVSVFNGNSWVDGSNGMKLNEGYKIKTLEQSEASVMFFDSSIIRLDSNTEISIDELQTANGRKALVSQNSGNSWNRVTKASGLSTYSVKTPNTVATVRGTAFYISLDNEKELYGVDTGEVAFSNLNGVDSVNAGDEVEFNKNTKNTKLRKIIRNNWIEKNNNKDNEFIKNTREKIKKKYSTKIKILKKARKLSDVEIDNYIDNYLAGKYGENQDKINEYMKKYGVEPQL